MFPAVQKMFKRRPTVPDAQIDRLTYAIGDIHGSYDQFVALLDVIQRDALAFRQRPRVVLLGDYIDRGPQSAGVMDKIVALDLENAAGRGWCDLEVLIGNHEAAMMDFLATGDGSMWLKYGGDTTLQSYGIAIPHQEDSQDLWDSLRRALDVALPQSHRDLIQRMKLRIECGDYMFVHAGVSPNKPLDQQGPDTFLWIRNEFLSATKACDFVVVHGHTPTLEPVNMRWRIGVDTCAYETGVLSAIRLHEGTRHFLSVGG